MVVLTVRTKALVLTQGGADYDTKYGTYLKLFSGEMFKAYESACIAKETVQNRTLTSGRSMQFIFTGRMTAEYHQPGEPILGSGAPPVAEKTIIMDDLLISSAFVYELDETLAHYSLRSEISAKIGHALAEAYDKKVFRTIAKAAREAHPITAAPGPEPGGSIIRLGETMSTMLKLWLMLSLKQLPFLMRRICLSLVASLSCPKSVLCTDLSG